MMLSNRPLDLVREEITRKIVYLGLIFFASLIVVFLVDRLQMRSINYYTGLVDNQQARSALGKAALHRLLMIEFEVQKLIDMTDGRTVEILHGSIEENLSGLRDILICLQHGGTFVNSMPANFYDHDRVEETIVYRRRSMEGYVMEVIDLTPKIMELGTSIERIVKEKIVLIESGHSADLILAHNTLKVQSMKVEALILRARESVNKIFFETQQEIRDLALQKQESGRKLGIARVAIFILTIGASCTLFARIIYRVRGILQDRREKSRNLNEAKDTIEAILDSIPVGVVIVNGKQEVVRINAEALRLFESESFSVVLGNTCSSLFDHSGDSGCPLCSDVGEDAVNEVTLTTFAGTEVTVLKSATNITLGGEQLILQAFMDITRRREMENLLQAQKEYTDAVLQGVQAGVVVIDAKSHTIVDLNESAARIIGIDRWEAVGSICHKYICPAEVGRCPVVDLGKTVDHTVRRLSNGKWVLKSVVPFHRGDDLYLLESFVDISDRIEVEEKLKEALDAADQANRAKSEFLSRMSHELRTPLNAIIGFSDLLLQETDDIRNSRQMSQVAHIREAGVHLMEMIEKILDFSRIESGKITINKEPVRVGDAVSECVKLMGKPAHDAGVTINIDGSLEGLPCILVDRTRFRQVLLNLISNAIKYNKENGTVTIEAKERGGAVRLGIHDTGMGIPLHMQGELFTPFTRLVEEDSGIEGEGVGMAITRILVEVMDGIITFSSEVGKGTSFFLQFPATEAQSSEEMVEIHEKQVAEGSRLLVYVDDDPGRIEDIRKAAPGWEGFTLVVRKRFDKGLQAVRLMGAAGLLVHDLFSEAAEDDGGKLIERGRELGVPVIILRETGEGREAEHFLVKPVAVERLNAIIERYSGGKA